MLEFCTGRYCITVSGHRMVIASNKYLKFGFALYVFMASLASKRKTHMLRNVRFLLRCITGNIGL